MTHRSDIRRQLFARIQLLVFAAMLTMSAIHVHEVVESTSADCTECQHNVHHSGHLTSAAFSLDDCVLCQLLGQSYLPAVATIAAIIISIISISRCERNQSVVPCMVATDKSRAPPFSF